MNKERLLKLADLLEADAANPEGIKFDLSFWGADAQYSGADWDTKEALQGQGVGLKPGRAIPVNCGTAACAVGLAAISGVFADEGLGYKLTCNGELSPMFDENESWDAVYDFFGLTEEQATSLFSDASYTVKRGAEAELAVATRIRRFVDGSYQPGDHESDAEGED